jgi:predicted ATP-grasp superfamily ATP-dependent carboligase
MHKDERASSRPGMAGKPGRVWGKTSPVCSVIAGGKARKFGQDKSALIQREDRIMLNTSAPRPEVMP